MAHAQEKLSWTPDQTHLSHRHDGDKSPLQGPPSVLVRILLGIFEAVNCGAILLDANKRVLHFNARAKECFRDGVTLANDRLCALSRPCDVMLQTALDQCLKYREAALRPIMREAVGLSRDEKACIIARVLPISPDAQWELGDATLIVILIDPEDCAEPSHALLEQVFGLTKSESRVASRLMCGQTLQEIAEHTGVTPGTVRSQIKSVFAKTNTHRQAQLVGLLTRLAMISEKEARPQQSRKHEGSTAKA